MERDPYEGGRDVGRDTNRDLGDEPPGALRDAAPDILSPIDESAPVSGHVPPPEKTASIADSPEHDWGLARELVRPAFRPVGTQGMHIETVDRDTLAQHTMQTHHSQPLLDTGPAGLPVVYTMPAGGFDVVVNGDHLLTWGIEPGQLQDAALRNLAIWASNAPWSEETSGDRRVISSDTGEGLDAVRILLPDALAYLAGELGSAGRVLVGIPERHLLVAATLRPEDPNFAALFGEFVIEQSGGADEPVDRRLFEIVDGRLVEFAG
jgi:hypothetical protein